MRTTYIVQATPIPSGGWTLLVEGVGVSQVRRLDQAEDEMATAVTELTGKDRESFVLDVRVNIPEEISTGLHEVEALQHEADQLAQQASIKRRELVQRLHDQEHRSLRDIGTIMNISHQRVSQLVSG